MTAPVWADEAQHGTEQNRELALVWPLLGRHIAFHRRLVDLTHSVKAAVLLSQAIYWTRHGRDIAVTGGWFHKTTTQWTMETGLTAREQAGARQVLCGLRLLSERRHGIPAVLHFRIASEQLASLLAARLGRSTGNLDWADGAMVFELLGPPLAYHRSLAAVTGGVHTGLLLSRALYLTRYSSRQLPGGWFYAPMKLWKSEIGLGRWEQEAARRELVRAGVWDEDIRGIPPRHFVRVRMAVLLARLTGKTAADQHYSQGSAASEFPDGGVATIKEVAIPPSSQRDGCQQHSTKPANQIRQNQQSRFNKTSKLNVRISTRYLVQPPPPTSDGEMPAGSLSDGGGWGGGDLILPQRLLPEERVAAIALVRRCPAHAQTLLDELHARLQKNTIHTSPVAYLRGMVQRAITGEFVPELAVGVAAARRKQAEEAIARAQRDADVQRLAAEQEAPEFHAKVAARRVQVRQMLDAMRARQYPDKAS